MEEVGATGHGWHESGKEATGVEGTERLGGERRISKKYYSGLCCHVRCPGVNVLLLQRT